MKSLFPILLLMSLSTMTFANNVLPVAIVTSSQGTIKANKLHVKAGITLNFSGSSSYDPDGGGITYYGAVPSAVEGWYVNGSLKHSGSYASSFSWNSGSMTQGANTLFTVRLMVRDNENTTSSRTITVYVVDEERNYFVTDHLGNVRATVNQNGDVIGYDDFYPYGQVMPGRSSNTANANDIYKFTGHERDAELGLDYMLARNYDPEIGRFLSVDPLYDKYPGLSPYMYVAGNPMKFVDPDGKKIINPNGIVLRNKRLIHALERFNGYIGAVTGLDNNDYVFRLSGGDRFLVDLEGIQGFKSEIHSHSDPGTYDNSIQKYHKTRHRNEDTNSLYNGLAADLVIEQNPGNVITPELLILAARFAGFDLGSEILGTGGKLKDDGNGGRTGGNYNPPHLHMALPKTESNLSPSLLHRVGWQPGKSSPFSDMNHEEKQSFYKEKFESKKE